MRLFKNINIGGNSQSIISNNGIHKITINGKTTIIKGGSVSICNGKIYVDGKLYKDDSLPENYIIENVIIEGTVENIDCGGSVTVNGNVDGDIDCGGSVTVTGNVDGNIDCGGSVTVNGDHDGNIDCGGSVRVNRR